MKSQVQEVAYRQSVNGHSCLTQITNDSIEVPGLLSSFFPQPPCLLLLLRESLQLLTTISVWTKCHDECYSRVMVYSATGPLYIKVWSSMCLRT